MYLKQGRDESEFRKDLGEFLANPAYTKQIVCRHGDCYSFGTVDSSKNVSMIRKSTVENFFRGKLKLDLVDSSTSTKCRVHQLVERLTGKRLEDTTLVVRHLCGCGECCNPKHLKAGTQGNNTRDTHVHYVYNLLYDKDELDLLEQLKNTLDLDLL